MNKLLNALIEKGLSPTLATAVITGGTIAIAFIVGILLQGIFKLVQQIAIFLGSVGNIFTPLTSLVTSVGTLISGIATNLSNLVNTITNVFNDIKTWLENLF